MATMARQLEALIAQQREFVADASHQLRTPLTALRLRLENLAADATTPEETAAFEATIDEADRLAALVDDLLSLARAERGVAARSMASVERDLVTLAAERVDTWSALAGDQGVELTLQAPAGPVPVFAVPGAIEQILDNLIDNAVTYGTDTDTDTDTEPGASRPASPVVVRIQFGPDGAQLSVEDRGPGLSEVDRGHAFDRFWRGDPSRPGSGLGLAIVETLAEASGGTVTMAANRPQGLVVTVTFPVRRRH